MSKLRVLVGLPETPKCSCADFTCTTSASFDHGRLILTRGDDPANWRALWESIDDCPVRPRQLVVTPTPRESAAAQEPTPTSSVPAA